LHEICKKRRDKDADYMSGQYGTGRNEHFNKGEEFEQTKAEKERFLKVLQHNKWIQKMVQKRLEDPLQRALLNRIIDCTPFDGDNLNN
jgi:hypothetical protein